MNDEQIIDLYWSRREEAVTETARKYGKYCNSIAFQILHNIEDSEECVNDTYMKAWDAIPPQRPRILSAFLGKITRNLALNRYKYYTTEKRGAGQIAVVLEELQECIPAKNDTEQIIEDELLIDILNSFLATLTPKSRKIFMRRYWYVSSIKEIASDYKLSESDVKMTLYRTREDLKKILEKEGVQV